MAQTDGLDIVIKLVQAGDKPASEAQKIIKIDNKTKKVVPEKSFGWWGDFRYYLVSNNSDSRHVAECKINVFNLRDHEYDCNVAVSVRYVASCERNCEAQLAEALCTSSNPVVALEELIKSWLMEESRRLGMVAFITDYFAKPAEVAARIREWALKKIGIALDLKKLAFEAEKSFATAKIGPVHFPIRVSDFDEEQDLRARVDLALDESRKAQAVLSHARNVSLEKLLRQAAQQYFPKQVTLHRFCTELGATHDLRSKFAEYLSGILKAEGRKVEFLSLNSKAAEDIERLKFWDNTAEPEDVSCTVQKYSKPVILKNSVKMILTDIARYRAQQSPDLKVWLKDKLNPITHKTLFGKEYSNLFIGFELLEELIKQELKTEAEKIGYDIEQLIAVPDLPPIAWRNYFTIEPSGTFETKSQEVRVPLKIVVTARVKNLKDIRDLINQQRDLLEKMETDILNAVMRFLHEVDPERFYMRFFFTDPERYPNEKISVEQELIVRVKNLLKEEFKAEVLQVIPKVDVDHDAIIKCLKELQREFCDFTIQVTSIHGGQDLTFEGQFRVDGVDANGWNDFVLRKCTLKEVKAHLETNIQRRLGILHEDILSAKGFDRLMEIEHLIRTLAVSLVQEWFGLSISINSLSRQLSSVEQELNWHHIKKIRAGIEVADAQLESAKSTEIATSEAVWDEIRILLEQRVELLRMEGTEENIKELDRRINEAKQKTSTHLIFPIDRSTRKYLPSPTEEANSRDFNKLKALVAGSPAGSSAEYPGNSPDDATDYQQEEK
jgi:hypothetical protein